MNKHETIIFIHIYMPTHKHIQRYMYKYISTDIQTRLPILASANAVSPFCPHLARGLSSVLHMGIQSEGPGQLCCDLTLSFYKRQM